MRTNTRLARKKFNLGKTQQKLMMILLGTLALGMARSPKYQYRLVRGMIAGWKEIDQQSEGECIVLSAPSVMRNKNIKRTVESLYRSKLVHRTEHKDGSITIMLTDEGRKRALRYHLATLKIEKQKQWDGKWRVVMYDVPEHMRDLRIELHSKLHSLGFVEVQKSVFAHPYECRNEIEFLIEAYDSREYVRRMLVEEIDISEPLKKAFAEEVATVQLRKDVSDHSHA